MSKNQHNMAASIQSMNKKVATLQKTIESLTSRKKTKVPKKRKNTNVQASRTIKQSTVAPRSIGYMTGSSHPRFSSQNTGMRISHREMFADFKMDLDAIPFQTNSFYANPGQQGTFPWLSVIAQQFEMYQFISLSFTFVPSSSTAIRGKLMMAFDYDGSDDPPQTKIEASSLHPSVENAIWSSQTLNIPLKQSSPFGNNRRYVRPGLSPPDTDIKTYDLGFIMFFVIDVDPDQWSAGQVVGDLWVDYTVEFFKPQVNFTQMALNLSQSHTSASPALTLPWGTDPDTYGGLLPIRLVNDPTVTTHGRVYFDKIGTYLMDLAITGTGINSNPSLSFTGPGIGGYEANSWIDGTTDGVQTCIVKVVVAGAHAIYAFAGIATTITGTILKIASYTDHTVAGF